MTVADDLSAYCAVVNEGEAAPPEGNGIVFYNRQPLYAVLNSANVKPRILFAIVGTAQNTNVGGNPVGPSQEAWVVLEGGEVLHLDERPGVKTS